MKIRWFLVGVIATSFLGDWLRMKAEQERLRSAVSAAQDIANDRIEAVASCNVVLTEVKTMLNNYELRTQIAVLARAQALDLFARSKRGDRQAQELLRELGIENSTPEELQRVISGRAVAMGRK